MKKLYFVFGALLLAMTSNAQLSIPTTDVPVFIDFTGFSGAGFQPGGGGGTLNSDDWSATGFSEGDLDFGATMITGDFARGTTMGLVNTGGVYGVDIAGNQGIMVQPVADELTPGSFILKNQKNTGVEVAELAIAYTIYVLNDQPRSNSFNFSVSYDNVTYNPIADLDYASPEAMDFTPYITPKSSSITGLAIPDGAVFYLRWTGDDVSGTGNRDEFAIDDISITAVEGEPLVLATFSPAADAVDEGVGTASGNISLTATTNCTVNVSINAASSTDFTDVPLTSFDVVFLDGDPTDYTFDIPVFDDIIDESDETLILDLTYISGACAIGLPSSFTLLITDNDDTPLPIYTEYDIAEVTTEDADGNALSIDEKVDLTGIAYGINTWDGGLQFTLIDNTGGISVFSFDNTFGYTVTEGDKVNILGTISQFNGLTEVEPDTLIFIDGGNTLKTPTEITVLNESTESDLVSIENSLTYVDITQWLGDGSSFNVDLTDGTNTYTIRIDDANELSTMPAPSNVEPFVLMVTGLGNQFDSDAPYTSGYQLFPRYADDIELITVLEVEDATQSGIQIYPNPVTDYFIVDGQQNIISVELVNQFGQVILLENNQSNTYSLNNIAVGIYSVKITTTNGVVSDNIVKL